MDIVDRIDKLCADNKISRTALEKEMSLGHGAIQKWRAHTPSVENIRRIAERFNVSVDYILTGETANGYYFDNDTAAVAQELFEDRDLRMLFDAARGARPQDLQMAAEMLRRFKETNPNG